MNKKQSVIVEFILLVCIIVGAVFIKPDDTYTMLAKQIASDAKVINVEPIYAELEDNTKVETEEMRMHIQCKDKSKTGTYIVYQNFVDEEASNMYKLKVTEDCFLYAFKEEY